jgi:hypothetical protein
VASSGNNKDKGGGVDGRRRGGLVGRLGRAALTVLLAVLSLIVELLPILGRMCGNLMVEPFYAFLHCVAIIFELVLATVFAIGAIFGIEFAALREWDREFFGRHEDVGLHLPQHVIYIVIVLSFTIGLALDYYFIIGTIAIYSKLVAVCGAISYS